MSTISLTIKNLEAVREEIKAYPQQVDRIINNEFKAFGQGTENEAKRLAPVNEGTLRESISATTSDKQVAIAVNVDYAAYLEFGTKGFAQSYVAGLPSDWQEFAAQYRGQGGGSFQEMLMRITMWVHSKGLGSGYQAPIGITGTYSVKTRKRTGSKSTQESQDKSAAYLIARKILIKGIPAQPYLFPAYEKELISLISNLKAQLPAK